MQRLLAETDEMTTLIKNALVKQSLLKQTVIENLLTNRDKFVDAAKREIQGNCYLIDYTQRKLKIFDTYTDEIFNSIDLPGSPTDFNQEDFESWGTSSAIIDPVEIHKEDDIPYDIQGNYGLVLTLNKCYLYNPGLDRQSLLGLTNQYICGAIPKKAKTNLPYDMYFSDDYSLLCLSNRDQGKIYLFDVKASAFTDEITIRNPGSNKTINPAISMVNKKIYISDSLSPILTIYDLATKSTSKSNLNIGYLGNLCLAPDEKSLYIIITKPEQNLKHINIENFSEIRSFHSKGELFSIGDAPCDLLALSPDKSHIYSMTFINDPEPFTPVITVIDIEKNKAVKRFSIKDDTKPINLCFKGINPLGPVNRTLEEMLIENGLFSINKLRDLKNAILDGTLDQVEKVEDVADKEFIEVEGEVLEFDIRHDKVTAGSHGGVFPKEVNRVIIPADAHKHIMELLLNSFWQKNEIDLNEVPEAKERLEKIAEKVRLKLEFFDLEIVEIKGFYNKKIPLDVIVLREYILEMIDEEESKTIKTVPTNCKNCTAPLLGSWKCSVCGFELEKPEDAIRRRTASADQLANLPKGNFFVLDSSRGELFEVSQFKIPVWRISKEDIGLKSITAAMRLENMNTLILDEESGTIAEVTPKGKIPWKYALADEKKPLNQPSCFNMIVNTSCLLIADSKNHRVMETDLDGNIIWEYGKFAEPGIKEGFLDNPVYIQKTYDGTYLVTDKGNNRIIELNRFVADTGNYEIRIDWKYGNEFNILGGGKGAGPNELDTPLMAIKELAGNVLILDNANMRVIEVNEKKEIIWQYHTKTDDKASSITNPIRMTRLKNKDLLIVGEGKYVQVLPGEENRVIWASTYDELSVRTDFKIVKEQVTKAQLKYGSSDRYLKITLNSARKPKPDKEKELKTIVEEKIKTTNISVPANLQGEKPFAVLTPGETVSNVPIILVDKIGNKVMLSDREANIYWSYGENEPEKLVRLKLAEITPKKTILITDAKGVSEIANSKVWEFECNASSAVRLNNGNTLITDERKSRVIEINKEKEIVWEYSNEEDGKAIIPFYASRLPNGNTLITYSTSHIVEEVNPEHKVIWRFGEKNKSAFDDRHLCFPEYAARLPDGNTLIADTKNGRVLEVSHASIVLWSYEGGGGQKLISPNYVNRLKDDHVFIVHGGNRQLLEIDNSGKIFWKLVMPLKR
jgi:hypothetical protein